MKSVEEWLDGPADGWGYGVAAGVIVFAVLAALLVAG